MSGSKALYRKYRGLNFDEILGQSHVTEPLKRAVKDGRISHAYLLTGPKGVGKTSVARILAHVINDLPYERESNHIDIIEIDAASNRRIDEIRDLREKAYISPTSAKYKVYIIDEVHMLTREAFNALLKTLEEPPAHVVFILATTELHKLPATIVSRTQRHSFRPITESVMQSHLQAVAKKENIAIDDDAIQLIATHSEGSLRDGLSLLDQVASVQDAETITREDVSDVLGLGSDTIIATLLDAIAAGDGQTVVSSLTELEKNGAEPVVIANQIASHIRQRTDYGSYLELIKQLLAIQQSSMPSIMLEVTLLEATLRSSGTSENQPPERTEPLQSKPEGATQTVKKAEQPREGSNTHEKKIAPAQNPDKTAKESKKATSATTPSGINPESWKRFISGIKAKNNAVASIFRTANVNLESSPIVVEVKFAFHKNKLTSKETQALIAQVASGIFTETPEIIYEVAATRAIAKPAEKAGAETSIEESVIATFGGGERVEL